MKRLIIIFLAIPCIVFAQIPSNQYLRGIHFFNTQHGIITCESGKMYQTINGGSTWSEMPQITGSYIRYFAQSDISTYFISGYDGALLKSTDNGFTWSLMNCGTNTQLTQLTFTSPTTGYLLGINGFAQKTTDGGETWNQMDIPTTQSVTSIKFINDTTGFIGGFGGVFRTTDAGETWTQVLTDGIYVSYQDLYFTDPLHGVAVGYSGRIQVTSNGGDTWTQITSGTSENLYDVTFSTPLKGFAAGRGGTFISTNDGGNSWNIIQLNPVVYVNSMVEFSDPVHGYLVGDNGTVYYSSDSGNTWSTTPPPLIVGSVTGTVRYKNSDSTLLPSCKVYLWDNENNKIDSTVTNTSGQFEFTSINPGEYNITAKPVHSWGGINSVDALLALKHFTHISTLTGLPLLAADVNGIQGVNTMDAYLIQRRFLNYISSFAIPDWISEKIYFTIQSNESHSISLHVICAGDVNGSYVPVLSGSTCPQGNSFSYGGQTYNTVQIGDRCWMKENLNIGTMINSTLSPSNNGVIEKYCYSNNAGNCDIYGGIYSWNELMNYNTTEGSQGICPSGWHIPSLSEYCSMLTYLDPTVNCSVTGWTGTNAGGKLKETGTSHWLSPNTGATNESGFKGLGCGYWSNYSGYGTFYSLHYTLSLWTSTPVSTSVSNNFYLYYNNANVYHQQLNTSNYYISARCVKDY